MGASGKESSGTCRTRFGLVSLRLALRLKVLYCKLQYHLVLRAEFTVVHYQCALGGGTSKAFVYYITRLIGQLASYPVLRPLMRFHIPETN